jgi:hypothetical protein
MMQPHTTKNGCSTVENLKKMWGKIRKKNTNA